MNNNLVLPKIFDLRTYHDTATTKKRKGFSMVEIMLALAVIIALGVGAFFAFNQVQQMRKIAQMNSDLDALAQGCLAYEAMNINSLPPDSLSDLVNGLSADESVDGTAHDNFVTSTKAEDGSFTDPWGTEYVYSQSDRTISCTPNDASGAAMDQVTGNF